MTALSSPHPMPSATLDKDYDYYGGTSEAVDASTSGSFTPNHHNDINNNINNNINNHINNNHGYPRVKKVLGAMPMQAVENCNPVTPPSFRQAVQHHSSDPPESTEFQPSSPSPSPPQQSQQQQQQQSEEDPEGQEGEEEFEQQEETVEGEEALLDLEQLEELHHEAERMKALGNKHMAAQVR
jgi:hypothetical protein